MPAARAGGSRLRDEREFEDFCAAVFDRLVGQFYVVIGNLQDAEDVVQEALTGRRSAGRGCASTASPRRGCGGWP